MNQSVYPAPRRGQASRLLSSGRLGLLAVAVVLAALSVAFSAALRAAEDAPVAAPLVQAEGGDKIVARLAVLRPGLPIESVTSTPVAGLVAVNLSDGSTYYGTTDGRYLLGGDLFNLEGTDLVNLTEQGRSGKRRSLIATIDTKDTVNFSPDGKPKAALYVFTDVDCGYCRKLHQEVPALNAKGIEVRYLAYPRAGVGSKSYDKIVSAWCAEDPQDALTRLKAGETVADRTCANPVADQYGLGRQLGISGTPAIVLEDGTLLPGYMPADQLAATLGI